MSVTNPRVLATNAIVNGLLASNEAIVCQLDGISTRSPDGTVVLRGSIDVTIGTGGTTGALRIRRGTTVTDTLVVEYGPVTVVAADRYVIDIDAIDNPGDVAGQSYVLTGDIETVSASSTVHAAALVATF